MSEREIIERITKKLREIHDGATPWTVRPRLMEYIKQLEAYGQKLTSSTPNQ